MIKFCAITPDRGDRPQFLEHCKYQMDRQTVKPDVHIITGPEAIEPGPFADIIPRIKAGIETVKYLGFNYVFIIENDDYYPDNYFEQMLFGFEKGYPFVGISKTIYYSIFLKRYSVLHHTGHSSLMCTGIDLNFFDYFPWPADTEKFLDKKIWAWAIENHIIKFIDPGNMPIGIKHGIGFCGGTGHNDNFPYQDFDSDMSWLKTTIRSESFAFYKSLIK